MKPFTRLAAVFVLTTTLLVVCAGPLLAMDYYVNGSNGDNANSGLSADNAWKTITHAIEAASATEGDPAVINIAPGTYAASTNGERFPLMLKSYLTLSGEDPRTTILDAEYVGGIIKSEDAFDATIASLCLTRGSHDPVIYCCNSFVMINNCHILNNRRASTILADGEDRGPRPRPLLGSLTLRGCTISNNNPGDEGWCIASRGEYVALTVEACAIEGNTAESVISARCPSVIESSAIQGNKASVAVLAATALMRVRRCLIARNCCKTIISATEVSLQDTIVRDNEGDRLLNLEHYSAQFHGCAIESNQVRAELFKSQGEFSWWIYIPNISLYDCLVTGNVSREGAIFKTVDKYVCRFGSGLAQLADSWGSGRIQIRRCSLADNHGGGRGARTAYNESTCGVDESIDIQDCVFSRNSLVLHRYYMYDELWYPWPSSVDHSCLQAEMEGEGNFVADPLFASGPLGDYYLSSVEAGQEADSPCIDAGSTSASITGVSHLTTRTDGAFDADTVDIGYHYSATPPTIDCFVSAGHEPLHPGDTLNASIDIENAGLPQWVDIYAGFILPDGSIFCVTPTGFTTDLVPWAATSLLPAGFASGDIAVFDGLVPGGLPEGPYTFAAALSLTGDFCPIGDIAFAQFALE